MQGHHVTGMQGQFTITQGDFTMVGWSSFDTDQFLVDPNVNYYKRTEYQNLCVLSEQNQLQRFVQEGEMSILFDEH